LLRACASVDACTITGATAYSIAHEREHVRSVRTLLSVGVHLLCVSAHVCDSAWFSY
jgi:hypothetical protein